MGKTIKENLVAMPGTLREHFKSGLQYYRKWHRLTQADLAEKSGVNLRMIQKYENGEKDINKAQAITLYKLSQALDCTIEDLLEL